MKKQKLEWHNEKRRVKDITPYKLNPNINTDKQSNNLLKSLEVNGYVEPIVIDVDGTSIAGEHRREALMKMGMADQEIDVRVPNRKLTKKEFDRYLIASNALRGQWDFEKLKIFDVGLLLDIGLDENTLVNLWDAHLEVENDDWDEVKELAKIKQPKTKVGDLFSLGSHRLVCGNSHDPSVLKKLFGKDQASMIYSDPIYNLGVDYNAGIGGKQNYGGTVNDKKSDSEYKDFLKKGLENALSVAKKDSHFFYFCDQKYIWLLQELYRELGIENKRVCLWIKNSQNPTPGVAFNKCYEPCVYGVKGQPYLAKNIQNLNEIANKELGTGNRLIDDVLDLLDIWLIKRLAGIEHPTAKPPALHEKAIRRCTKPGDIILDSYLGSGSTLIAAEQLKRRCYGVELEPIFLDLSIKRYEQLTNLKAKKLN